MKAYFSLAAAAWLAIPSVAVAQADRVEGADVGERIRRDLGTLFQPDGSLQGAYGDLAGAQGRLRTRSYATTVTGICRRDEVILSYAGRGPQGSARAADAAPFGVSAEAWFKVLRDVRGSDSVYRGPPFEGECAGLDGTQNQGWFVAPDVYAAAGGYRAMATAIAHLARSGSISGCRESRQARQACRSVLPAAILTRITRIHPCPASRGRFCFAVYSEDDGMVVTIRMRYNGSGEERIESLGFEYPGLSIQTAPR